MEISSRVKNMSAEANTGTANQVDEFTPGLKFSSTVSDVNFILNVLTFHIQEQKNHSFLADNDTGYMGLIAAPEMLKRFNKISFRAVCRSAQLHRYSNIHCVHDWCPLTAVCTISKIHCNNPPSGPPRQPTEGNTCGHHHLKLS